MTTVHGRACSASSPTEKCCPDADTLARDIDDAITELRARTSELPETVLPPLMLAAAARLEDRRSRTA